MAELGPAKVRGHGQVSGPAGLGQTVPAGTWGARSALLCGPGGAASSRKVAGLPRSAPRPLPREVRPPEPISQMGRSQSPAPTRPPPTSKLSGRLRNANPGDFLVRGARPRGVAGRSLTRHGRPPRARGAPALLPPGSAVPAPRGARPTSRAVRMSGPGTSSASPRGPSPQPARERQGPICRWGRPRRREGQLLAQGHTASGTKPGGRRGLRFPALAVPARVPAPVPRRDTHSPSCPRAPAPPRTRSGQRPWCPRRGPPRARVPRLASIAQRPVRPRVPRESGRAGAGLSRGFRVGPRARPLIAAEGGAPRS